MDKDIKKEALKQYFKYFWMWFVLLGILFVVWIGKITVESLTRNVGRRNDLAPQERVFDYADVLTDEEEQRLRAYIAECEKKAKVDIVIVTAVEDVEARGYWEYSMMDIADEFYDDNNFGYDEPRGDGVLLLDNWYQDQEGSWLSTCGSAINKIGDYGVDEILDEVYYYVERDPYKAYHTYVGMVTKMMMKSSIQIPILLVILAPVVVAVIYAFANMSQKKAKDTTSAKTYVAGGKTLMNVQRDDFLRKNVTRRQVQSSSGGGGRSGASSHRSSSGTRHGGGGRRR